MAQILTKITRASETLGNLNNAYSHQFRLLESSLEETDKIILPVLKDLIRKHTDKSIWEQLDYSLINKSHFDRAFFVKLGCEAVGGDYKKILPAMASVELRYASGTAIDDVFDFNDERMGKPSMPKKYGPNIALSIGAILKSISSISLLSNGKELNMDLSQFIDICIKEEITHYQVYLGQISDILSETLPIEKIDDNFYLEMITNATGVDAGYCFELGCFLGGGTKYQQKSIFEFGVALGTAMQIRDDLLDYVNDKDLINKIPFRDFETKKKRLPLLLAYRFGSSEERKTIERLLDKGSLNENEKNILASFISNEIVISYIADLKNKLVGAAKNHFQKVGARESTNQIISEIISQIDV